MSRFLTTVAALFAGSALACQFSPATPTPEAGRREYQRYFYLSGINAPGNHIDGITYTVEGSNVRASYTAVNHQTVYLPLTVYVGAADLCGGANAVSGQTTAGSGSELSRVTLTVQYRVLPDTTWQTAGTKRFLSGDVSVAKLFKAAQIDCQASAGDVVLIRLYVTVENFYQINGQGTTLSTSSNLENADPTSDVISVSSDIAAEETESFLVAEGSSNLLTPGLNFTLDGVTYQDGWTPQFVMAVTIGSKRRPGK